MRTERLILTALILALLFGAGYAVGTHQIPWPAYTKVAAHRSDASAQREAVTAFYHDISAGNYRSAYDRLSRSYKSGTSFGAFVQGYQTTKAVRVETGVPRNRAVPTTIYSTDDTANGDQHRTFDGSWRVVLEDGHWKLDDGAFKTVADDNATTEASSTTTDSQADSGDGIAVGADGDGVAVFRDQSSYCGSIIAIAAIKAEYQNGQISKDQALYKATHIDGAAQLMQRVHVRKIEQGSFDCNDGLGPGVVWKVRVLDGDETGLEGYVVDSVFDQS